MSDKQNIKQLERKPFFQIYMRSQDEKEDENNF